MSRLPETAFIALPPDWACEIISASTASIDRGKKLPINARERVEHVRIADPLARTLEVFRLERDRWTLLATHAGAEIVQAEPFEAVALDRSLLWEPAP